MKPNIRWYVPASVFITSMHGLTQVDLWIR